MYCVTKHLMEGVEGEGEGKTKGIPTKRTKKRGGESDLHYSTKSEAHRRLRTNISGVSSQTKREERG